MYFGVFFLSFLVFPMVIGKFRVWQEVWQRIPKAELANIPRIF